ncbi:KaiC domain-containing protein [Geoglobus ahangari]
MHLLSTGIRGLDVMLGGGIPRGHMVAVVGQYGTGKTTLGLHFIYEGLKNGERGVIISFDEDEESVIQTAESFGMHFSDFQDQIVVMRLEAEDVKRSLERVESEVKMLVDDIKPSRMLIDSISVLETLYDDAGRYRMLARVRSLVKSSGVTAILTSECDRTNPFSSKYGIIEYVSDGLISLRIIRESELEEAILAIEVVKMRQMNHSRRPRPYSITSSGIEVFEEAEIM